MMKSKMKLKFFKLLTGIVLLLNPFLLADEEEKAAKKLTSPFSSIKSLPIQFNYHRSLGFEDDGEKWTANLQPIVPFELNNDWKLITHTTIPLVSQAKIFPGAGTQNGIGDIILNAWATPTLRSKDGWKLGAGPVFFIPSGSEVSTNKWGIGPSAIAIKRQGSWTYGGYGNHIWSVGGSDKIVDRINTTYLQPFVSYVTLEAYTVSILSESTYNWKNDQLSIPVFGMVSKMTKIGNQLILLGGGVSYWAKSVDNGPEGWGARLLVTFVFAK